MRKVSYTAWDGWCSKRQETIRERFPVRRVEYGVHSDRKLFAKGFLSSVRRVAYIAPGNCLRKVSYTAWGVWYTWRQETIREGFPVRRRKKGIHADRKLFAKGFLYGVGWIAFIATGNCSRKVSYTAWEGWCSKRQETVCERFPIRRGMDCIHSDRKLFAKGFLYCVRRMVYIATGNCSRKVSYTAW